jgi:hypothetical protein
MSSKDTRDPSWRFSETKSELARDVESRYRSILRNQASTGEGGGSRRVEAAEFVSHDEYWRVFFRVEQARVAALLPVGDPQADDLAERRGLGAVNGEAPERRNSEDIWPIQNEKKAATHHVLHSDAGLAIVRVDYGLHVYRFVGASNRLVTYGQWAHAALAQWYRIDSALHPNAYQEPLSLESPRAFITRLEPFGDHAERIRMTIGRPQASSFGVAPNQEIAVDVIAWASYDQTIALSAVAAFRVFSAQPWFEAWTSLPELRKPKAKGAMARTGGAEGDSESNDEMDYRLRGIEQSGVRATHYIPATFLSVLSARNRNPLITSYFEAFGLKLEQLPRDMHEYVDRSLLATAYEKASENVGVKLPITPATAQAPAQKRSRTEQALMNKSKRLNPLEHEAILGIASVQRFALRLRRLGEKDLAPGRRLALLTAVLGADDARLASSSNPVELVTERLASRILSTHKEPSERAESVLQQASAAYLGIRLWRDSVAADESVSGTLLEAVFVMTVYREHLSLLFGLNSKRYTELLDGFVEKFGDADISLRDYVASSTGRANAYFELL